MTQFIVLFVLPRDLDLMEYWLLDVTGSQYTVNSFAFFIFPHCYHFHYTIYLFTCFLLCYYNNHGLCYNCILSLSVRRLFLLWMITSLFYFLFHYCSRFHGYSPFIFVEHIVFSFYCLLLTTRPLKHSVDCLKGESFPRFLASIDSFALFSTVSQLTANKRPDNMSLFRDCSTNCICINFNLKAIFALGGT